MKLKKNVGAIIFVIGISLLMFLKFGMIGYVVSETNVTSEITNFFWGILNLMFIIGGLLMILGLEKEVSVFSIARKFQDKTYSENEIYITDPYNNFGNQKGTISLEEFRTKINEFKKDPELMEVIKEEYYSPLKDIKDGGGEKAIFAVKFLEVLGYPEEKSGGLSKDEKNRIKNTFKNYTNGLTPAQKKIIKEYGGKIEDTERHYKIIFGKTRPVTVSRSPSDKRAGLNISHNIIHLIEEDMGLR